MFNITYFTGDDGYQNILVFTSMFNSLILDKSNKFTNWISTGVWSGKIKPFEVNLALTLINLVNGRVNLKLKNTVLVQKNILRNIVTSF